MKKGRNSNLRSLETFHLEVDVQKKTEYKKKDEGRENLFFFFEIGQLFDFHCKAAKIMNLIYFYLSKSNDMTRFERNIMIIFNKRRF